jgi:hypothetical protein
MAPLSPMKMKLLPWIGFHRDLRVMIFRPRGILSPQLIQDGIGVLEKAEEEFPEPFNRFTDFSKLDAVDLDDSFILEISLHRRQAYGKHPPGKSAFYVTSAATERFVRTLAQVTDDSPTQVKMFKDVAEAAKWLEVAVEDLEMVP